MITKRSVLMRVALYLNIILLISTLELKGITTNYEYSVFYGKLPLEDIVNRYLSSQEYLSETDLCLIMKRNGSDKGSDWHNYTTLYSHIFSNWKNEELNIFEMGIGSINPKIPSNMSFKGLDAIPGASLFGWSEYFPNANIFGADIDRDILFTTNKISTFFCDQRDKVSIDRMYANKELYNCMFDIIIDDGLHKFKANKIFLENSINKLKKGGVYIIEDLNQTTTNAFKEILQYLKLKYSFLFIDIIEIPHKYNFTDNRIIIIQK